MTKISDVELAVACELDEVVFAFDNMEHKCPHVILRVGKTNRRRAKVDTWLMIEKNPGGTFCGSVLGNIQYKVSVATAGGGAWSYFGNFGILPARIEVSLKSIKGIFDHRFEFENFTFEFSNPQFPRNLLKFLREAALNAQSSYTLSSLRSNNRHQRAYRAMEAVCGRK